MLEIYPSFLQTLDINYMKFSSGSFLPEVIQLTPLSFPQKLNYTQSSLVEGESSDESEPSICHQKIKVDTNISENLHETTKYLIHSLILKVLLIRKCLEKLILIMKIV